MKVMIAVDESTSAENAFARKCWYSKLFKVLLIYSKFPTYSTAVYNNTKQDKIFN